MKLLSFKFNFPFLILFISLSYKVYQNQTEFQINLNPLQIFKSKCPTLLLKNIESKGNTEKTNENNTSKGFNY